MAESSTQKPAEDIQAGATTIYDDLRAPLNDIAGLTDLLAGTGLTVQQAGYLNLIKTAGKNLLDIINRYPDLNDTETEKPGLENVPFNIYSLIKETVAVNVAYAAERGIDIAYSIGSDVPECFCGDLFKLKRVLEDLIGYAVDFSEVGNVEADLSLLQDFGANAMIRIKIKNGGGNAAELTAPIHSPANAEKDILQGDTVFARSKNIIALMGGSITAESARGTAFVIDLTLLKTSAYPVAIQTGDEFHSGIKSVNILHKRYDPMDEIRILIAEENAADRKLAVKMLRILGYHADIASDSRQAVEMCIKNRYGLIFIGCNMPAADCYHTSCEIKSRELNCGASIVWMTESGAADDSAKCPEAVIDDHIQKPVTLSGMENMMKKWYNTAED
jgi:CheY-like chemotaxis protein